MGVADGAAVVVAGCSVTWVWGGPGFPDRARPTISPSVRRPPPRRRARRLSLALSLGPSRNVVCELMHS